MINGGGLAEWRREPAALAPIPYRFALYSRSMTPKSAAASPTILQGEGAAETGLKLSSMMVRHKANPDGEPGENTEITNSKIANCANERDYGAYS